MKKWMFFLYIFSFVVYSQKTPNLSLLKTQNEKLQAWVDYCGAVSDAENYKQLITIANQGISLAKNNEIYLAKFYFYKGYGHEYNNNQYAEAVFCFEKSLYYAQKTKQLEDETLALMRLNYVYYSTNNFTKRKRLIDYIKKVADTTKNIQTKSVLNGSIGEYYLDNSAYEPFIQYQLKAINYKKLLPKNDSNLENIGISYSQIASAYAKMKQFKKH